MYVYPNSTSYALYILHRASNRVSRLAESNFIQNMRDTQWIRSMCWCQMWDIILLDPIKNWKSNNSTRFTDSVSTTNVNQVTQNPIRFVVSIDQATTHLPAHEPRSIPLQASAFWAWACRSEQHPSQCSQVLFCTQRRLPESFAAFVVDELSRLISSVQNTTGRFRLVFHVFGRNDEDDMGSNPDLADWNTIDMLRRLSMTLPVYCSRQNIGREGIGSAQRNPEQNGSSQNL